MSRFLSFCLCSFYLGFLLHWFHFALFFSVLVPVCLGSNCFHSAVVTFCPAVPYCLHSSMPLFLCVFLHLFTLLVGLVSLSRSSIKKFHLLFHSFFSVHSLSHSVTRPYLPACHLTHFSNGDGAGRRRRRLVLRLSSARSRPINQSRTCHGPRRRHRPTC